MSAILFGSEQFARAQHEAIAAGAQSGDEQLRAAGIDPSAAHREAACMVDTFESYGVGGREAMVAAFLAGLELGVRCARLRP